MDPENKTLHFDTQISKDRDEYELETYGDDVQIASFERTKIPLFLIVAYLFLPIWGVLEFYWFWNGSSSLFDAGYVTGLQEAAGTTFPFEDENDENPRSPLPKS